MRLLLLSFALVGGSAVTTYTIDSVEDGPGQCPTHGQYKCTYRAALQAVIDTQSDQPFVIDMLPGTYKIDYQGLPRLQCIHGESSKRLSIVGARKDRSILDGVNTHQMLISSTCMDIDVSNIDFINGLADGTGQGGSNGGAITNDGKMTLNNCNFYDNKCRAAGGAIQNTGDMMITHAKFLRNSAGDSGGALSSSGTNDKHMSLMAADITFADNRAVHNAGAVQTTHGSAVFTTVSFKNHSTTEVGSYAGTVQNAEGTSLTMTDATIEDSTSGNGGILANSGTFLGERVTFTNGNASVQSGGAVFNQGLATFKACVFSDNVAQNAPGTSHDYPQGATIANVGDGSASAHLINCTIDAKRAMTNPPGKIPSELYNSAPGSLLNLTFVTITNCHESLIKLEDPGNPDHKHPDHKVIVRGSSICNDGSYDAATTLDALNKKWIAACNETQAPWQCGTRATCDTFALADDEDGDASSGEHPVDHPANVGISCTCPDGNDPSGASTQMFGFPYGPDAEMLPGSAGFSGCFEQWNAALDDLSGDNCLISPAYNQTSTDAEYACCVLRGADGVPTSARVLATANSLDHGSVDTPTSPAVAVSAANLTHDVSIVARSFDNHTIEYEVAVSYVPGDAHCTPGESAPCLDSSGVMQTCLSNTTYPIDELNSTSVCLTAPSAVACGYTTFGAECTCPQCTPSKMYACHCPSGFGQTVCDADGEILSECDCSAPYPYDMPPPPPPPSASETGLSGGAWAAIGGAVALVIAGAIGIPVYLSRKRAQAVAAPVNAGLLPDNGASPA